MGYGLHAGQDRHHARVRVGDDFERYLFELQGLAAHQVRAQADRAFVDHGDWEQRLRLVPAGIGDDMAGRPKIVRARLVVEPWMPVPVTHVIRAKAGV